MKKQYLTAIRYRNAATMHIAINTDSTRPVYVYYCGRDTGKRYVNVGSAARYLEKIAASWGAGTVKTYAAPAGIPIYGSDPGNAAAARRQLA